MRGRGPHLTLLVELLTPGLGALHVQDVAS